MYILIGWLALQMLTAGGGEEGAGGRAPAKK